MKVVEVPEFGGPQVITIIEKPTRPNRGKLLIEVKAAGVIMRMSWRVPVSIRKSPAPFALALKWPAW